MIMAICLTACQRETWLQQEEDIPDGFMPLNISFAAPDMIDVDTKSVDPDGKGVNSMTLFCFDNFGMFVQFVYVTENEIIKSGSETSLTGIIANTHVPENTRRIHFVANQNMSTFNINDFRGKSEFEVATQLEGSSGMMIYWGYFAAGGDVNDSEDFQNALREKHGVEKNDDKWQQVGGATPIRLLRNQARFKVDPGTSGFEKTGFTVVNTCAFGTVAPYHPEKGFNFSMITTGNGDDESWDIYCDWVKDNFITLPENKTRLTPPEDVDKADETCVFETDNNSAQPVSIIIKGHNSGETEDKYYRVILMDESGEYVKVRRNFSYTINITGKLLYPQDTFEDALTAPATNNIWLSIDDDVTEVNDKTYTLSVKETNIIVLAENLGTEEDPIWNLSKPATGLQYDIVDNQVDLGYDLTDNNGYSVNESEAPEASWVEGSNISNTEVVNKFKDREISVFLDKLDGLAASPQIEGTVLLKKGVLQRKIKIIVLKKMEFTPLWVSTQVNTAANSNVTLLFTVPESCPDELLPFNVYVSVDHLDIRSSSGRTFPIITRLTDPDNYGADTYSQYTDVAGNVAQGAKPIGYKYVYTVTQKGDQRMYFTNMLDRSEQLGNLTEWFTVESPYFKTERKQFTFNTSGDFRIEMPGLKIFTPTSSSEGEGGSSEDISQFSPDEQIKYILVPQKKNAVVELDLALVEGAVDMDKSGENDEFFIYSENLIHNIGHAECHCEFKDFDPELWGSGGRIQAFRFYKEGRLQNTTPKSFGGVNRKVYTLRLKTSKANSEEVVRISSNHTGSARAFDTGTYDGKVYRSIIFEMANYSPFEFDAAVGYGGRIYSGDFMMSYAPEQDVDIYLDIKSFTSQTDQAEVDPFGTQFDVYISAPMLELNMTAEQSSSGKLTEIREGLFKYTVAASANDENSSVFNYNANGRKKLPFKKKSIVADGEILITTNPAEVGLADEQIVNFNGARFKVASQRITGTIQKSSNADGSAPSNLDADAFVSFALSRNNSRIGSITVHGEDTAHGNKSWYELTLRPEYSFNWTEYEPGKNEKIKLSHAHYDSNGDLTEVFQLEIDNLAALAGNPNIILTAPAQGN